jgi:lysophospholipase L1-like esterase
MTYFFKVLALALCMAGSTATAQSGTRILAMGDSFFATNSAQNKAIPNVLAKILREPVRNRAVAGARIIYRLPISGSLGFKIEQQYKPGTWDWIVINGGGNDLMLGCGCNRCDARMNKMISRDGTKGEIPRLIAKLGKTNARIVYSGYFRTPGTESPIEGCGDEGQELDARLTRMAQRDKGVWFVSMADVVPYGDRSFHRFDMIHPSPKGSATAATRIAKVILKHR